MNPFKPHIKVDYPPNNKIIFEEWFDENYQGCNTDRELLPIWFTPYWVNNNYGNDAIAKYDLHKFIETLDKSKKYFTIIQYDDGSMINWDEYGLDVLEFNMSKNIGVQLPLLCQPHPYSFSSPKKYLASFVGSRTHPIRNELDKFKGKEDWYISFEPHNIQDYCRIISESIFTICPRGYGANSFRICEAMQYNSIPIYISDEFIIPFNTKEVNDYMVLLMPKDVGRLDNILDFSKDVPIFRDMFEWYNKFYTYQGCFNQMLKTLENEYIMQNIRI